MGSMASQITSLTIVYSAVYSGASNQLAIYGITNSDITMTSVHSDVYIHEWL